MACVCPLSFLSIVWPVFVVCLFFPLYGLFFFDLRLLIIPLVSSNFS
jgi:hypothetical protein